MVGMLTFAGLAQAQFRTSIQGVVTDASGAVISGANLTLTNPATGEKQVRTSNDSGVFNFNALPASVPFRLEVEKQGFQKQVLNHVELIPDQANALGVQLEIGTTSQTVTVDAAALPELETETASTSGVISDNQIQHMPSFGRDVIKVAALALGSFGENAQGSGGGAENLPGTQTGGGASGGSNGIFQTENGAQIVANGGQTENNGITIDGISTTSAVWGGSTVITPSEDSVESVKVVSNSYDAEDGRFNGAQIKITSKSGSNNIHGSAFFTAHRPGLNAFQRFNGAGNPVLRDDNFFDQFGGSVSGPIWKNKVFAFFAYETVRSPAAQTNLSTGWYDTAAFDALAPAGSISSEYLTFPGSGVVNKGISPNATCLTAGLTEGVNCVTIPGQGLNIGSPLTTGLGTQDLGWTQPSNPGVGGGLSNVADIAEYLTTSPSSYSKAQYNGRLDADVTAKDHVGFALYWVPQSSTFLNGPSREYNFFHHSQINDAFSVIWNHTFSPSLLNELRVNAAGWRWNEVADNPQSPVGLPSDSIGQIGSINLESFGPNVGSILNQWTYSYKDVATKIIGRHTLKFGGEATRLFYLQDCAGCGVPSYSFFNLWDFLNDAPSSEGGGFNPRTGAPTTIRQDQRTNILGFFAQDDFKLRKNLTINLGIRWSYFSPLTSKEGNMLQATPGAGSAYLTGLTVHKGNSWNAQKDNIGPEIGFAWSPEMFKDKLVIRGGYGLNYNQEQLAISANISNNPGSVIFPSLSISTPTSPNPGIIYATSANLHNLNAYPANPNTVLTFGANGLPVSGVGLGVEIFPGTLPTMRAHHYSLDTQYDLGHQWVMTLGYQGSLSRNTFFHSNPNAIPAAQGYALNPQIGGGDDWGVNGSGNYNALLSELKHQFSHQFLADAQFTWARSLDTSSAPYSEQDYPYNPSLNYGPSDFNVAKALKLFGVYQPVIFHGSKGWIEKIAGDWSISPILNIHSGFPWTPVASVSAGSLYCGQCGYSQLPALYLGGAGTSTSNDQFKTGANYPKGAMAYFATPAYTSYAGTTFGNSLPQVARRNSLTGPGYRDVDITLAKGFGLPNNKVLGENAKLEFRLDAYNLFNNLNFNPTSISNNIAVSNFGTDTAALGARTMTLGVRFNF
jgi:hypothetical protein